jgi:hypothetical protein
MKTLTYIDKIIIKVLIAVFVFFILYVTIQYTSVTLKVIGTTIGVAYMFFILLHLGLLYPLIWIIGSTVELLNSTPFFKAIKEKSKIIQTLLLVISCIVVLSIVYYGIPILACMFYNNNFDFIAADNLLREIQNK